MRRLINTLASWLTTGAIATACLMAAGCAVAAGSATDTWREEVLLHDGQ